MSLSALRSVGDAIDATREFMMPVAVRRWLALAVAVLFMGTPGTPVPANPQFFDPRLWQPPEPPQGPEAGGEPVAMSPTEADVQVPPLSEWPRAIFYVVGLLALLGVLYVFLGVLMRFVFVEALRSDGVAVLGDARSHLGNALRVLGFRAVLWTVFIVPLGLAAVVASPLGPDVLSGPAAWLVGVLGTAIAVTVWVIDAVTIQFVVPVMIHEGGGVVDGWRRLRASLVDEWLEYVVFGVVRTILGAAVGIAAVLAIAVALLLGGIVFGTVGAVVVVVAGGSLTGLSTGALLVLAVVGVAFVAYALVTYAVVSVPFQVYLWSYALLVLGDVDDGLDLIPSFRAAAREERLTTAG